MSAVNLQGSFNAIQARGTVTRDRKLFGGKKTCVLLFADDLNKGIGFNVEAQTAQQGLKGKRVTLRVNLDGEVKMISVKVKSLAKKSGIVKEEIKKLAANPEQLKARIDQQQSTIKKIRDKNTQARNLANRTLIKKTKEMLDNKQNEPKQPLATGVDIENIIKDFSDPNADLGELAQQRNITFTEEQKKEITTKIQGNQSKNRIQFETDLPKIKKELNKTFAHLKEEAKSSGLGTIRTTIEYRSGDPPTTKKIGCSVNKDGSYFIDIPNSFIGRGGSKKVSLSMSNTGQIVAHATIDKKYGVVVDDNCKPIVEWDAVEGDEIIMEKCKESSSIHRVLAIGIFQETGKEILNSTDKFLGSENDPRLYHFEVYSEIQTNGDLKATFADDRTPSSTIIRHSIEMCEALELLHDKDIIYNDFKPENCFLNDKGKGVLADFDTIVDLKELPENQKKKAVVTSRGTDAFLSPERTSQNQYLRTNRQKIDEELPETDPYVKEATEKKIDFPEARKFFHEKPAEVGKRGDVYALGISIWMGLHHKDSAKETPWGTVGNNKNELFEKKCRGYEKKEEEDKGPIEDVIKKLLEPDVSKRPSITEAKEMLNNVLLEQEKWEREQKSKASQDQPQKSTTAIPSPSQRQPQRSARSQSPGKSTPTKESPTVPVKKTSLRQKSRFPAFSPSEPLNESSSSKHRTQESLVDDEKTAPKIAKSYSPQVGRADSSPVSKPKYPTEVPPSPQFRGPLTTSQNPTKTTRKRGNAPSPKLSPEAQRLFEERLAERKSSSQSSPTTPSQPSNSPPSSPRTSNVRRPLPTTPSPNSSPPPKRPSSATNRPTVPSRPAKQPPSGSTRNTSPPQPSPQNEENSPKTSPNVVRPKPGMIRPLSRKNG